MRKFKKILAIALCIVMLFNLVACASTSQGNSSTDKAEDNSSNNSQANDQAKNDQVLRINMGTDPNSIDPQKGQGMLALSIIYHMQEGLVSAREEGIVPGIAETWELSDDEKVYTFHLRDASWSDGQKITAQDFEYSFKRFLDPKTGTSTAHFGYFILNGLDVNKGNVSVDELGVKAIDEKTLEITLENPTGYFLEILAKQQFCPTRKDIVERYGEEFASSPDKLLYTGPFVLSEWQRENYMTFTKNPNYWNKDTVKMDKIEFKVINDSNTAAAMFDNGELDIVLSINSAEYKSRGDDASTFYTGGTEYMVLNHTRQIMANLNFRKALNYAIDKEIYASLSSDGLLEPYGRICLDYGKGFEKTYGQEYPIDVNLKADAEKAKEFLAKALSELNIKAEDINLELIVTESEKRKAEIIQEACNDVLGITVTVKQMPQKQKTELINSANYDMALYGWAMTYDDPIYNLNIYDTENSASQTKYSNPKLDELLAKSKTMLNSRERYDVLFEAEKLLLDDQAVIPLTLVKTAYLVNDNLRNVYRGFKVPNSAFAWVEWAE